MRGNRFLTRSSTPTMPTRAAHSEVPAAMAVDLTKTYGAGDTEVCRGERVGRRPS